MLMRTAQTGTPWKLVLARPREGAFARQGPDHPRADVEPGIGGGDEGGEDDEIHDVPGERQADAFEDQDEGAGAHPGPLPGDEGGHDGDGSDEEDGQAENGAMDGAGDGFPWVFGLAGGHAHHFGSGKGEDDGQQGGENGGDSGGEEPVFGEIDQAGSVADAGTASSPSCSYATRVKGEDPHNRRQTDQDEDHDGDHFDAGEPELRLAINPYGQDVQAEDQTDEERAPQGRRASGKPVPHDDPGGGELGG